MTQKVSSLFRDSEAPSAAVDASPHAARSADSAASDAAKEGRLLSQLLLLFSVKRQHSAVAALFPHHIESSADGQFAFVDASTSSTNMPASTAAVVSHGLPSPAADGGSAAAVALDAHVHPATDAALATSLLRTRPSERELVQQFLLLPQTSRNKVAQSLFVVPPSLLEDFAVILQFFLRVVIEAHSDSRLHHYDHTHALQHHDDSEEGKDDDAVRTTTVVPEKTCSWAKNGDVPCVSYEPDETATAAAATSGGALPTATNAVFTLPAGFHACLVDVYGSVHRSKCEEVWHGDHMAYRCRTCGLSDSSCMCLACFDPDDHEGHDYRVYRCSSGGCCDCGDPLAWKPEGFCKKHRQQALTNEPDATLGGLEHDVIYGLVRRVVAFCMNALREIYTFCLRPGAISSSASSASSSFDTFFSPSQKTTMRSLPRTGRRRSSFPTVMQVHLDRLQQCLAWLQALAVSCLPYRQIVTKVFLESLPPDFQLDGASPHPLFDSFPPRPLAILDVFLKAGVLLPVEMCDTLGVLYLKLLFDQPFKQQYTCHFVDWYPYFIELYLTASDENNDEGMRNLSRFIDRLFCQLFHSTAQLRELERASKERAEAFSPRELLKEQSSCSVVERLLVLLLEKLIGLFKNTLRVELVPARGDSSAPVVESIQVVDCGRNVFKKRVYARLCSDIRTLLVHPLVAGEVLLGSFAREDDKLYLRESSVYALLIQAYETLQEMDMQQRHIQHHIEFESQNWTFAFVVDYEMNLLLSAFLAGLPYCFQGYEDTATNLDPSWSNWEVARALVDPLRTALERWSTRSGSGSLHHEGENEDLQVNEAELDAIARFYQEPPRANNQTPRTAKKSSFHLPLHHMFAAVFKGVGAFVKLSSLDDWTRLLFGREVSSESDGEYRQHHDDVAFLFQVAESPLRVASFAREIKAGLWVRNGNVMWQQLVHYYAKHWRFFGLHGDLFIIQLSALMLPRGSITRMLMQHQIPMIGPLLDRENQSSVRHASELLEEVLRLSIQLVLSPLRYPTASSSLEEYATWLLEREMKHWLSLGPFSRSEMVTHLDLKLVEQVRQMPHHEWFLLEEEEIIGHVLERVGVYDDPYGVATVGSGDPVAAAVSGYGMKMSGVWSLKTEFWREISPLFECFSPSEAQLCEQNLKKQQLRARVKIEDACVLPVPTAHQTLDYFLSARQLASHVLHASSLLAVVHTVLTRWLDDNTGRSGSVRAADARCTSESLVVASIQSLSVAVQLLDGGSDSGVANEALGLSGSSSFEDVELLFEGAKHRDFFSQLCLESEESDPSRRMSIITALLQLNASTALSPDTRALAQSVLETATKKSTVCHEYVKSRKVDKGASDTSDGSGSSTGGGDTPGDKQQLAKEMMRRRQQEILDRMRSQQQKFLSSQSGGHEGDERSSHRGEDMGIKCVGDDNEAEDCSHSDDDDDEACISTEYEEEDEDEDDEWGFPAGHVDLELYFSHVASAVSQICDRERKAIHRSSRRLRRRTQSRVRADSLGGVDAASTSPSISSSSLDQDEDCEIEECALCRLPCESHTDKDSTFGYVAMVQPTTLPTKLAMTATSSPLPVLRSTVEISDRTGTTTATSLESKCNGDAVVWTCGHAIHHACIKGYIDSLWKQRPNRNPLEGMQHQGDGRLLSERDLEFLCPVCRRLSNCLLPDVTALLRPRPEGSFLGNSRFSLLSASSVGDDSDSFDGDAAFATDHSRHSFTKWLKGSMRSSFSSTSSPFASSSSFTLSSRQLRDDGDFADIVRKRVMKFCAQLKLRSVRASLQLPLLLSGFADDELVIDAELRHVAETWGQQFSNWQLLLRCLQVELDVTLHERELSGTVTTPAGATPDRLRLQSLRLLVETAVAAAMSSTGERPLSRSRSSIVFEMDNLESSVASTSEVLFGRRVLFAEDDDELVEAEDRSETKRSKPLTSANAPLLSHPYLFEVFSKRLTALMAMSASRCASTSEDYRYTETLLSDIFFTARVVVTAQILQALCAAVLTLPPPSPPATVSSPPRSPATHTPRARKIIADFSDVETLGDAMQWAQLLLVRCRLLPANSVVTASRLEWDMSVVETMVVDHVLPLLRRIVLLIQASLPRVLDDGGGGGTGGEASEGDPCALCDELYRPGNAEFSRRSVDPSRSDLRALLRRLHLPPLRLFFRRVVFAPQQRELCQLWGAQMESKAAVLRRRRSQYQDQQQQDQPSPSSLKTLLVPSLTSTLRGDRKRLFIDLPKVYMDLFIKYNDKPLGQCQQCHQVPQHPAICLFCGAVVCCFSSCCESARGGRVGECTQHAQSCGLGTGAFLLLRACTVILFLGNARRCVWGSLYVDKNGEEDPYLRRGRTLFLAPHRLLALETLLVSHGFAQNTAILTNTSRRDGHRY